MRHSPLCQPFRYNALSIISLPATIIYQKAQLQRQLFSLKVCNNQISTKDQYNLLDKIFSLHQYKMSFVFIYQGGQNYGGLAVMKELLYTSSVIQGFTSDMLDAIEQKSVHNNLQDAITGVLFYDGKSFMQIIEGPEQKIDRLYDKILMDDRHNQITLLHTSYIDKRSFTDWSLRLIQVPPDLFKKKFDMITQAKRHPSTGVDIAKLLFDSIFTYS